MNEERSHFSVTIPQLQTVWDSTSIGLLKECPRKYYYTMIENWRSKSEALALNFGLGFHGALEEWDRSLARGEGHEQAVRCAVRVALKWGKVEVIAKTDDNRRNPFALVRAVVWYLEQFGANDPMQTVILENGKPAVELSFKLTLDHYAPDGQPYVLAGHLDRLARMGEDLWICDRKSTVMTLSQSYFQQFSPNNQMSLYDYAGRSILSESVKGVIVDAAQSAAGFARYQRAFVNHTPAQLDEWLESTLEHIAAAERYAERNYWPLNESSCNKYGGCPFIGICSKDPAVRQPFLNTDFEKVVWNPLIER